MNTNNSEPIVLLSIDPSNERNPLKIERKRKEGEKEANITRKREEEKKKKESRHLRELFLVATRMEGIGQPESETRMVRGGK